MQKKIAALEARVDELVSRVEKLEGAADRPRPATPVSVPGKLSMSPEGRPICSAHGPVFPNRVGACPKCYCAARKREVMAGWAARAN
jgi:hypothetical protein